MEHPLEFISDDLQSPLLDFTDRVYRNSSTATSSILGCVSTMIVLRGIVKSNIAQKTMIDLTEQVWRQAQRKDATAARLVDEL
uniref:Uncharacterized protein n=1 Tax=Bionectria ochroleuca TaxID=29856 RepID=A0A0B7KDE7_BIOOC